MNERGVKPEALTPAKDVEERFSINWTAMKKIAQGFKE